MEDPVNNLDEQALAYQIGAYMRNVVCIYLNIEDLRACRVSYWMSTASGTQKKEWTRAQLDKVAVGGGLRNFLSHTISMAAVST